MQSDENLQVRFANTELVSYAMGDKIAGIDPAANSLGGDVNLFGRLLYGEECRERVLRHY